LVRSIKEFNTSDSSSESSSSISNSINSNIPSTASKTHLSLKIVREPLDIATAIVTVVCSSSKEDNDHRLKPTESADELNGNDMGSYSVDEENRRACRRRREIEIIRARCIEASIE